ncbi:MAG: lytic transglycosylase domain-containing protein [Sandaracinaceae bacterium]|nr:lytic transglycosylase domain-containing protein [Sandaracinaceae bacterium]
MDAAYPRPWAERAGAAASAVGLTPAHLYAVMWQESGFDPDAVSYADAIGLMQLLPATAERVAEGAGVELTRDMLFDPAVNIRLGARVRGQLAERFGVPLCFAAFNAGGHRVQAWLEERGEIELDLFVEHIPYNQTRNYVRRVTTHLAHYLYLEDPSRGWPPLELPRTVAPRPR